MKWQALFGISLFCCSVDMILVTCPVQAAREVHVIKYAADGKILKETTVSYQWMEANLLIHPANYHHDI
ncbi:MAG: hypothetical protein PHD13_05565 [Methanocellales archaeon]|nr:hypothetical protein [Methanocellales archaeon]MDD3292364.1 hypothetical protein [Methanocellales archaeon]MDD5235622.1 hypothetical protein [Methanocellales archaeon]MDD5485731.1 hypothetical protein [Methanocellales archaeon]